MTQQFDALPAAPAAAKTLSDLPRRHIAVSQLHEPGEVKPIAASAATGGVQPMVAFEVLPDGIDDDPLHGPRG